jgi:hypothetical protein
MFGEILLIIVANFPRHSFGKVVLQHYVHIFAGPLANNYSSVASFDWERDPDPVHSFYLF